jgi:hypothetical protein
MNPYDSYQKDGLDTLLYLCKQACRIISVWEPVIREKYGDNEAIIALLDLNIELCGLLPAAQTEFKALSTDATLPPSDTSEAAGINPDAPAAEAPDIT